MQMVAIFMVFVAAILLSMKPPGDEKRLGDDVDTWMYSTGLIYVSAASVLSGVAGALCERANRASILQTDEERVAAPNVFPTRRSMSSVSSAEMAVYQIIIPVFGQIVYLLYRLTFYPNENFKSSIHFNNWTLSAFFPAFVSACGGILVGGFNSIDNGQVKKSFALIAGLVLTALAEKLFYKKDLTNTQLIAGAMVGVSIFLHTIQTPNAIRALFTRPHND